MVTPEHKLGQMIMNLAKKAVFIKLGMKTSMVQGDLIELQCSIIKAGKSLTVHEHFNVRNLEDIADADVVADAIYEKLRKS